MGNYEDFFYEVKETLDKQGLNEEFNKQLKKCNFKININIKQLGKLGLMP